MIFILEPSEQAKTAIGKRVTVVDYPNGRLSVRHKGGEPAYRTERCATLGLRARPTPDPR